MERCTSLAALHSLMPLREVFSLRNEAETVVGSTWLRAGCDADAACDVWQKGEFGFVDKGDAAESEGKEG